MATYENQANGYRETVGAGSVVLALLFGWCVGSIGVHVVTVHPSL
jgi:hypothetical protein